MKKHLTKIFAVMAMSVMSLTVWAGDFNGTNYNQKITLPSAVDLSYGTYTGFNSNGFFTNANKIENSKKDAAAQFSFTVSEASSFLFSLQASNGNRYGDYPCDLKVKIWADGGSEPSEPNVTFTVADDDNWNNFVSYAYATSELAAGDYYLKIIWTDQANVQNIKFSPIYAPSTSVLPLTSTVLMSDYHFGEPSRGKDRDPMGYMKQNDYIEYPVYISSLSDCLVSFKASIMDGDPGVVSVSMTNISTRISVNREVPIAVSGAWTTYLSYKTLFASVESGVYLMRVTWTTGTPNFGSLKVLTPNHGMIEPSSSAFPLTNTNAMTAYKFGSDNEKNIEDHLASMKQDDYIEYPVYFSSARDYLVSFKTSTNADDQNIQVTITNLSTSEATNKVVSIRNTGNYDTYDYNLVIFPITEEGTYLLRFAFPTVNGSNYAPNFGDLKLQNPETVYAALPLTGEAVLDLSQWPTSGNPRYQSDNQNLGYIYHNNTAFFYVYNSNPTAHYNLSAGIYTNVSDANLIVTVTDVATGNAEINEEAFDVAEGNNSYPIQTFALSGVITPGLKLITFKFTKDEVPVEPNPWLYNINNISFTMLHYTREHPHMNLNTLCYPYQIDYYTGATFYTILSTEVEDGNLTKLVLEEHQGALEAGVPYFYDPTEGETELVCYYSGARQDEPQTASNGAFVGAYDDNDNMAVPEGSYVTVNNQLYKCGANVTLAEYRAYVRPQTFTRAAVPGRRRLVLGGNKTPTDIENVSAKLDGSRKVLRDGKLFIIRDGKTYNAMGQIVK